MEIRNNKIDNGQAFDWGKTSKDYAKYRDIYPKAFYDRLAALSLGVKGQKVLDLGTGTGVIPRNMYHYGAEWTGADITENQIAYARILSQEAGMDIEYIVSAAEDIEFPDESFDVVTARHIYKRELARADKGVPWNRGILIERDRNRRMGKGAYVIHADVTGNI